MNALNTDIVKCDQCGSVMAITELADQTVLYACTNQECGFQKIWSGKQKANNDMYYSPETLEKNVTEGQDNNV